MLPEQRLDVRLPDNGAEEGIQYKKYWLEFRLEKLLEFCLEVPHTKKMFKNG